MPVTATTFVIGAAALAGIPPLSGFFSKDEILLAVKEGLNPAFLLFALAAVCLSALYMARVTFVVFFGKLRSENDGAHEPSVLMSGPVIFLAFLALTLGALAFSWSEFYRGFATFVTHGQALGGTANEFHILPWLSITSAALVISGIVVGWATYVNGVIPHADIARRLVGLRSVLDHKYYVDELYQWLIDRVVLGVGRFVAVFDRVVINDTGVDGTAFSVMLSAMRLRYIQSGRLYNYGLGMSLGVLGLSVIWWLLVR